MTPLFFKKKLPGDVPDLAQLDEMYGNVIAKLDTKSRVHYCNNLLVQCGLDLTEVLTSSEIERINLLIKSSKKEISKLEKEE